MKCTNCQRYKATKSLSKQVELHLTVMIGERESVIDWPIKELCSKCWKKLGVEIEQNIQADCIPYFDD
ncbi:MAG: hypothetical protein C0467_14060 [Planctomycetaceae bacterium]|nr:hypothetical protein [Planctomycetaceae bacterium]